MSNVPELRFPEFEGEWEEKRLGEIISIANKKEDPSKSSILDKCIELEHLSSKDGILLGFIDPKKQKSLKNMFYKGQVLYGKLRPYLRKYWLATFNGLCSSEIWVLHGKKVTNNFLYYLIQGDRFNQVANISCGSKMPRADWSLMKNANNFIPLEKEQTRIADFLTLIDKKITKQDEKVAALEQYKKGLMHKIFSHEIRFKDDDGNDYPEWEEKLFGDTFKYFPTYSYSRAMMSDVGSIKYIHYGDIHMKYHSILDVEKANMPYMNSDFNASVVPEGAFCKNGDLLIADASEDYDAIGKATVLINIGDNRIIGGLHTILARDEQDFMTEKFRGYMIASEYVQNQIRIIAVGAKVLGISKTSLSNIRLTIPTLPEQTKIANFLGLYDRKIEKEKAKLEALREQKKGLLQQMFV